MQPLSICRPVGCVVKGRQGDRVLEGGREGKGERGREGGRERRPNH
jgi:hypothetical protein